MHPAPVFRGRGACSIFLIAEAFESIRPVTQRKETIISLFCPYKTDFSTFHKKSENSIKTITEFSRFEIRKSFASLKKKF